MDERFKELAHLVGEQLARRWVERSVEHATAPEGTAGSEVATREGEEAQVAPRERINEETRA